MPDFQNKRTTKTLSNIRSRSDMCFPPHTHKRQKLLCSLHTAVIRIILYVSILTVQNIELPKQQKILLISTTSSSLSCSHAAAATPARQSWRQPGPTVGQPFPAAPPPAPRQRHATRSSGLLPPEELAQEQHMLTVLLDGASRRRRRRGT